ncbi:MAG: copper chaperone PCu(A)C [Pseudomonadota bacterium]|nr:copper chaperone PCu(A)C [Pseudomonadota bacterium]
MTLRALFAIALTLVSSALGASDTLIISDAWVRATPPGKMMTAGYASLENVSKDVITITGVSAEVAGHTSLHETRIERDRSTMRPVAKLSIKAGERVSLKPGGLHIMLMKLSEPLTDGQSIDICLELENNDSLCSAFSVTRHRKAEHHH